MGGEYRRIVDMVYESVIFSGVVAPPADDEVWFRTGLGTRW